MKKWIMMLILLFLLGCDQSDFIEYNEEVAQVVGVNDEVVPHFEEIEALLAQVELQVGLGHLTIASSLFHELMELVEGHEVTAHQQARINTMAELLADRLVNADDERFFSGSDAAAKVMNMIGSVPEGYLFVYHEVPSFIGSDGLGYYVFLVPVNHDQLETVQIRETFFVTDRGEIMVIE